MNYQSKPNELMLIFHDEAYQMLKEKYVDTYSQLEYYAWPQQFSNTGGPFAKHGGIYGQAFTTWTLEAWTDGNNTLIFCKGKVISISVQVGFDPQGYRHV